jgi:hypothetical protein
MADIQAHLSLRFDTLQKAVDQMAADQRKAQTFLEEQARAVKAIRLPVVQAAGTNPFSMGGDVGTLNVSPEQGFVWSLRALTIEGLTRGATPDVIQIRRSSATGQILWELNGNQYSQTWGRGEIVIFAGETLFYQSIGTFASVATIKAYGMAEQVPGEKIAIFF